MTQLSRFLLCLCFVLMLCCPALAQDADQVSPSQTSEAATRFERGLEFYETGDYALALIEFERAYSLVPDFRVLYNVGQVSIQLSRFARARIALTQYLERGAGQLDESRQAAVEKDLEMLKARTALLTILTEQEGVELLVDDTPVGTSPLKEPLLLDAGEHRVVSGNLGYLASTDRITLAGADNQTLRIVLDIAEPTAPLVVAKSEPKESTILPSEASTVAAPRRINPWLVAGWTTTGTLAVGAAVVGILGMSSSGQAKNIAAQPNPSQGDYDDAVDRSRTRFLVADILAGTALVTGGVTFYFQLKARDTPETEKLSLGIGTNRISLAGTF